MKFNFNTSVSLLGIYFSKISIHTGVKPNKDAVKHPKTDEYVEIKYWMWGKFIEPYDRCLRYYGFGPFLLIVMPN